jgi:putative hydrolase of the HAD superfamily
MSSEITLIAFDADDTLWHNERFFADHFRDYATVLSEYHDRETVEKRLYETEMRNLPLYGYGVKSMTLSSLETAMELTEGAIPASELKRILEMGKELLRHPLELLEGVAEVIPQLAERYRLALITKGDLHDQERKITASGLAEWFERTEIVSKKDLPTYATIFASLGVAPRQVVMVGNSLKSDILPVLEWGGAGVHIPHEFTWEHEKAPPPKGYGARFAELCSMHALPGWLQDRG